jgi:hypothetical protein
MPMRYVLTFVLVTVAGTAAAVAQDAPPLTPIPRTERRPDAPPINQPLSAGDRPGGKVGVPPEFVIGVWYQPRNSLAMWKARGINTLIGYESETHTVPLEDWEAAAALSDLFMIRQPRPIPQDDLKNEPYLLAWLLGDEPDIHNLPAEPLISQYKVLKQAAPQMPVFMNVSGGNLLFKRTPRVMYEQYFQAADWIGNDFYPVTGWGQPTWLSRVGQAVDLCREISKGKPQFAFIEGANQQLSWVKNPRGVTPAELRCEIWDAVIHGVKGIVYFPQQMQPFKFDAMPTAVSSEMMRQNMLLDSIGPALATPPNPREMKAVADAPLEVAWRKGHDGKAYVIALNLSNETQKAQALRLTGFPTGSGKDLTEEDRAVTFTNNGLVDDFRAYGVHVYAIDVKP